MESLTLDDEGVDQSDDTAGQQKQKSDNGHEFRAAIKIGAVNNHQCSDCFQNGAQLCFVQTQTGTDQTDQAADKDKEEGRIASTHGAHGGANAAHQAKNRADET